MSTSAALVVIDMQLCGFDGEITPAIEDGARLLSNASKLISAAREAGMPVVYVQHCGFAGMPYSKEAHGWEIHPALAPRDGEAVVFKRQSSAFEDTDLRAVLDASGITTLITCGIQSEHCLTNTSLAALDIGMDVLVPMEAHGTVSTATDDAAAIVHRQNALLSARGARVQPIASVLSIIADGPPD